MIVTLETRPGPIILISDAHLGAPVGPADREARLVRFLQSLIGRIGALFILGDLFDFWFEYRQVVPKGTLPVFRALGEIVDSGVPVSYFCGNHDFWIGSFFKDELGLRVFDEPVTTSLQGRSVHLAHGDGLGPGDSGYKFLKKILRHPLAIAGFRTLHPDLGIPLARRLSTVSRSHTETREILLPRILRDIAGPALQGEVSAMVMGHVHEPAHYQGDGLDFLVIGDWLENLTFVRLEEGRFSLYRWREDREVLVPPMPFPDGWRDRPD